MKTEQQLSDALKELSANYKPSSETTEDDVTRRALGVAYATIQWAKGNPHSPKTLIQHLKEMGVI